MKSGVFGFPLHEDTISYLEFERISSFDEGLHRIHLFKIINEKILKVAMNSLAHVNHYAAVWRESKGIETEYLFR